jgi:hypothetical protein
MVNLSQRARDRVLKLGVVLIIVGFVGFGLLQPRFAQIPHYQKVALCLPILIGAMMMQINTYLELGAEVTSSNARSQGYAIGLLVAVPPAIAYCVIAWLQDVAG